MIGTGADYVVPLQLENLARGWVQSRARWSRYFV
jgi:hypothetical protein